MIVIDFLKNALEIPSFTLYEVFCMSLRSVIVYFLGVLIVYSNKKIIGIRTPLNFMLFAMLGSLFANAIIVSKTFLPIACAITILVFLNYIMKTIVFKFPIIERLIKGKPVILIKDGKINMQVIELHGITKRELLDELISQSHNNDISIVKKATLASDGSIDFIFK